MIILEQHDDEHTIIIIVILTTTTTTSPLVIFSSRCLVYFCLGMRRKVFHVPGKYFTDVSLPTIWFSAGFHGFDITLADLWAGHPRFH